MKEEWRLSWNIRNFPRSTGCSTSKIIRLGIIWTLRILLYVLRFWDFPDPILWPSGSFGCFDHQSYEFSGGVWILRGTSLLARKQRSLIWQRQYPNSVAHNILSCTHLKENWTATHTRKDIHDNCSRSYHSQDCTIYIHLCHVLLPYICTLYPSSLPFETTKHSFRRVITRRCVVSKRHRFMIQGTPSKLQCLGQGRKVRNPQLLRHVFREVLNLTLKNLPDIPGLSVDISKKKMDWKPQKTTLSERLARFLGVLNQIYQRGWLPEPSPKYGERSVTCHLPHIRKHKTKDKNYKVGPYDRYKRSYNLLEMDL